MGRIRLRDQAEHRFSVENLSAYLDGELREPEAERVRRHVKACAYCQQELSTLRATVSLLRRAPKQSLPRSFVLPRSAQPEQARQRRWNATFVFMRAGTVAVTAMLVLTLSADIVFRRGLIPLSVPSAPQAGATAYGEPAASLGAQTVVVEAAAEKSAEAAPTATEAAPAEEPAAVDTVVALTAPAAEATAVEAEALAAAATAPAPRERVAAGSPVSAAQTEEPRGEPAPAEGVAAVQAAPMQTEEPSPAPQAKALAPTEAPDVVIATEGGAVPAEQSAQPAAADTRAWAAWQLVRTMLGILVGLLCITGAGLLWSAYKRGT